MTQLAAQFTSVSKKNKKRLILAIFASFLLVAAIIAVVAGVKSHINATKKAAAHAIIMASCNSTRYPDLCYSTFATVPGVADEVAPLSTSGVLKYINRTGDAIQSNKYEADKLLTNDNDLTKEQKALIRGCIASYDTSLIDLDKVTKSLEANPNKKYVQQQSFADDLETQVSSCITNHDTCLDGFSHSWINRFLRRVFSSKQGNAGKMCSNALSLLKQLVKDTNANAVANGLIKTTNRKLEEDNDHNNEAAGGWPEWLSVSDKRLLLQSSWLTPDVVVAADGSGHYRTVSAAVAAAPEHSRKRYIIKIKAGVYRENVVVPSENTNIMFLGDGRKKTIITGSRNVVDGSTTYHSATVVVEGHGFLAREITFQNTAGPSKYQAVALRVESDFAAFYKCGMVAYQNTLHVHSNRQFFINCFVAGTVDFIFGNSAAVFQNCDIQARRPNPGQIITITAQGRSDPNQNTGIVIQKSRIGATADLQAVRSNFTAYLGRPWKEYSRTVIMQSSISDVINPAGWREWKSRFALNTLYYAEYDNSGAGAGTSKRVTWKGYKVITDAAEAQSFTARKFITGGAWLRYTPFPFSLGL